MTSLDSDTKGPQAPRTRRSGGGRRIDMDMQGPKEEMAHYVRWLLGWEGAEDSKRPFINVRITGMKTGIAPSTISIIAKGFPVKPAILQKLADGIEGADYKKLMVLAGHFPDKTKDQNGTGGAEKEVSNQSEKVAEDDALAIPTLTIMGNGNNRNSTGMLSDIKDAENVKILPLKFLDDIKRLDAALSEKVQVESDRRKISPDTLILNAINQYLETDEEREWREGFEAMGCDADTNNVEYLLPAAREVVLGK